MKKVTLVPILFCLLLTGCLKHNEPWEKLNDDEQELYFVNQFGVSMMNSYYLWNQEVADALKTWEYNSEPISKTKEVRYKDEQGRDIDQWTQMTSNFAGFQGQVTGNTVSSGMEYAVIADPSSSEAAMVVTYVYAGSPAELAGLKRGDKIVALNNNAITTANYKQLAAATLNSGMPCSLKMADGSSKNILAKEMYLNPVHLHKVIEKDGRKIGYLHYTSYTLKSIPELIKVFKGFKDAGISELVLDLRYNGGGYTRTSEVLASMLAPVSAVDDGCIYQRDIYNTKLTEAWGEEVTKFTTEFTYDDEGTERTVSTAGANPNVSKIYVIVSRNTASASEANVCGLLPYTDMKLIGERTCGKFCGGIIVDGPTFYDWVKDELNKKTMDAAVKYTDNWGIYVMISRYADKDGNTLSMPSGLTPDIMVSDDPMDGYELGDENETMLSVALNGLPPKTLSSRSVRHEALDYSQHPEVRILTPRNIFAK